MHLRIGNTVITKKRNAERNAERNAKTKTNTYEIRNDACPHLMKSVAATGIKTPTFEARDVMTLKEFLERSSHGTELYAALCLLHDMGRQMQALLSGGHGIACFSVDDVVIITHRESDAFTHSDPESTLGGADPQFLFLNDRMIFEVDGSDGALLIDRALNLILNLNLNPKSAFVAPELAEEPLTGPLTGPLMRVHFKAAYYSVAQLLIYFLLGPSDSSSSGDKQGIMSTSLNLNPIKGTKLYWFLLRCLNRVPSDRSYVYV